RLDRLRLAPWRRPGDVLRRGIRRHWPGRQTPAIAILPGGLATLRHLFRLLQVECGLAILRGEGIDVDYVFDAIAGAVGDAGRHHAAVGMADQVDVAQVFGL